MPPAPWRLAGKALIGLGLGLGLVRGVCGGDLAKAHSGGTNSEGCHAGSQPYHCHNSSEESDSSSTQNTPITNDSGTIEGLSYGLWNEPGASIPGQSSRILRSEFLSRNNIINPDYSERNFDANRNFNLVYQDDYGFTGVYHHNGKTGEVISDVYLEVRLYNSKFTDYRSFRITDFAIGVENPIVIEGENLGRLDGIFSYNNINSNGFFRDTNKYYTFSNVFYSSGNSKGAFSSSDSSEGTPNLVAGEVKVRYGDFTSPSKNSLVGIFVASDGSSTNNLKDIPLSFSFPASDSGTVNGLSYGLWNEPDAFNLQVEFLSVNDEVNPYHEERDFDVDRNFNLTYQDDDGFKGYYSHNGETGVITSDVNLQVRLYNSRFSDYQSFRITSFSIGAENPIVIEGQNLGTLNGLLNYADVNSNGFFRDRDEYYTFSDVFYSSGIAEGAFSDENTKQGNPSLVAGEIKVRYGDFSNPTKNSLVGVFAADVEE